MKRAAMRRFLEQTLRDLGEPEAIEACRTPDTEAVLLTSAAYGGGGQEGAALLAELTTLGVMVKLAACHGKQVVVIPQEAPGE